MLELGFESRYSGSRAPPLPGETDIWAGTLKDEKGVETNSGMAGGSILQGTGSEIAL